MESHRPIVAIDFGTSTSLVGYYELGGVVLIPDNGSNMLGKGEVLNWTPSLISHRKKENLPLLKIGWDVRNDGLLTHPNTIRNIKLHLGNRKREFNLCNEQYIAYEVCALILHSIKIRAENHLTQAIDDVVISIPAIFGVKQRRGLIAAAKLAGFREINLINEPTAAAFFHAINSSHVDENVLVFDFGGGTLDITILEKKQGNIRVSSTYGDPELGGYEFDNALEKLLQQKILTEDSSLESRINKNELLEKAEIIKWQLTNSENAFFNTNYFDGTDIHRGEFENITRPLIVRAKQCIDTTLARSRITKTQIDRVIPVGGTSLIPSIQRLLKEEFGNKFDSNALKGDLAITSVVRGATLFAAKLANVLKNQSNFHLSDVAGCGLGIRLVNSSQESRPKIYSTLVTADKNIPNTFKGTAYIPAKNDGVAINIFEADVKEEQVLFDSLKRPELIATGEASNILPKPDRTDRAIHYTMHYDSNGVVTVSANIDSGQTVIVNQVDAINELELKTSEKNVKNVWLNTKTDWNTGRVLYETEIPHIEKAPKPTLTPNDLASSHLELIKSAKSLATQDSITPALRRELDYSSNNLSAAIKANKPDKEISLLSNDLKNKISEAQRLIKKNA